jgi:Ohr subfamily peroxiredoxin
MSTTIGTIVYTGKTRVTNGRDGAARSSDGRLDVPLAHFNSRGPGTNPEQLLGAGWGACYLSALAAVCTEAKVPFPADAAADVEIDLGVKPGNDYGLRARFNLHLPGIDAEVARELAAAAHRVCPYSKSLHGKVDVTTTIA